MTKKHKTISAAELLAKLSADPDFVARPLYVYDE
jgi:hypothetical protein